MEKKVIVITGGTSGIGRAIALQLSGEGHTVYATTRAVHPTPTLEGFTLITLDLNSDASIHAAMQQVISVEGRIDVLINNAGSGMAGAVEDATTEETFRLFQTNVFGLLTCCRAVIPQMRAQGSGKIINISSLAANFGLPFRGIYSASKSAIERFSETMRMELAQWNIYVSIVQPGDFHTNINANRQVAARGFTGASPFHKVFTEQYKRISDDVLKAKNPVLVARVVSKIVAAPKPKINYPVATLVQKLSIVLNRILPRAWFQRMLTARYPVK